MNGQAASDSDRRNGSLFKPLTLSQGVLFALVAVVLFHLAYLFSWCAWCSAIFLYCLFRLASLGSGKLASRFGLAVGLAAYSPHLAFFWTLFGVGAIALWSILSFWLGLFVLLGRASRARFGPFVWAMAAPFLWTGLEYFRSELYYLRFSWLSPGYAFSGSAVLPFLAGFGTYGIGFLFMAWAAYLGTVAQLSRVARLVAGVMLAVVSTIPLWLTAAGSADVKPIHVVGVQLEGSPPGMVKSALDTALKKYPQTDLFVLSEYAFFGPLPAQIPDWCKAHGKWLVVGAEDPISPDQYYNTVFVIAPDGAIAFRQAKCVPVQFMKDGSPALEQHVWNSPWGKLGFGICYDASYTRVTDELIRQGAQGLIFPTMDVAEWGAAQHKLHGRIAPMRAAEYKVPIFRLCSSGISQFVEPGGHVMATAPFPGQGSMLTAQMVLPAQGGRMPLDRPLAELSVVVTAALILFLIFDRFLGPPRRS